VKQCKKCGESKPLDGFYAHPKNSDGLSGKCKECAKADVRNNYAANQDYYKEYEKSRANLPHRVEARKAYAQTEGGRIASNRAKRSFLERNPLKRAAHIAVGNAIRDGKLNRKPCEKCGTEKSQAHHDDYTKPLYVRWLCTKHHAEWHRHNTPYCPDQSEAA
jgi:ribosomal protein S27AE